MALGPSSFQQDEGPDRGQRPSLPMVVVCTLNNGPLKSLSTSLDHSPGPLQVSSHRCTFASPYSKQP